MLPIYWDNKYDVGIERFNDHHKYIMKLRNEMATNVKWGAPKKDFMKIMEELMNYTAIHFHEEEKLLKACHFPGFDEHQKEHERLIRKIVNLSGDIYETGFNSKNLVIFLTDWIFNHIEKTDKHYKHFFPKIFLRWGKIRSENWIGPLA